MATRTQIRHASAVVVLSLSAVVAALIPALGERPKSSSGAARVVEALVQPTIDAASALLGSRPRLLSVDHVVGSPDIDYVDPEFWSPEKLMVWQDRDNNVWLCQLDSETGDLMPADGRGQKLGTAAPMIGKKTSEETRSLNSGEWGMSQRGLAVYFVTLADNGHYNAVRVSVPDGAQETLTLPEQDVFVGVLPSVNADDRQVRVMYEIPSGDPLVSYWQEETNPSTARIFPNAYIGSTGPRWILGERAICTNVKDEDGVKQIARYDIDTDVTTILTHGPGEKTDGFFFAAPEFDNEPMFVCLIDGLSVGVYRQVEGTWIQWNNITPPRAAAPDVELAVRSDEPFTYRGRSYVTYVYEGGDQSAVCVAAVDGSVNAVINTPSSLRKIDPEWAILDDKLWIYYWTNETEHAQLHAVRGRYR